MWYINTMEYYVVDKNKDIMKFGGKRIKLEKENIMTEVTQTQKDKYSMCTLIIKY